MHFSTLTGAAALLALTPSALAAGSAHVINNCGFPIYYASVGQSQHAEMQELQGSYSEAYSKPGVGVSIKLSPSMDGPVSQFEFTWDGGKIYYDVSNIDGAPFAGSGMTLVPSQMNDPNNPTCQEVDCPAGEAVCAAAYNNPDDVRTTVCSDSSDLTLTLCPGGSGTAPTDSSSGPTSDSSSPSESATPASSAPPTTTSSAGHTLISPTWSPRFHPRHLPRK